MRVHLRRRATKLSGQILSAQPPAAGAFGAGCATWVSIVFRWLSVLVPLTAALAQHGPVSEVREVMIPMRDGILLATDLYMPPPNVRGPYPVLLQRTPYNKRNENFTGQARYFADHGYLVA